MTGLRIAYLTGEYPRATDTFIQREVAALREQGVEVHTCSVRRTSTDWTHTGLVTAFGDELFHTVEGNTNDEGSREGYEVCARMRGYGSKDFIML